MTILCWYFGEGHGRWMGLQQSYMCARGTELSHQTSGYQPILPASCCSRSDTFSSWTNRASSSAALALRAGWTKRQFGRPAKTWCCLGCWLWIAWTHLTETRSSHRSCKHAPKGVLNATHRSFRDEKIDAWPLHSTPWHFPSPIYFVRVLGGWRIQIALIKTGSAALIEQYHYRFVLMIWNHCMQLWAFSRAFHRNLTITSVIM